MRKAMLADRVSKWEEISYMQRQGARGARPVPEHCLSHWRAAYVAQTDKKHRYRTALLRHSFE